MLLPSLPHLPWCQLLTAPLPSLAKQTLEALDRCTPVEAPPAPVEPFTPVVPPS
jgi:hypothetical protein